MGGAKLCTCMYHSRRSLHIYRQSVAHKQGPGNSCFQERLFKSQDSPTKDVVLRFLIDSCAIWLCAYGSEECYGSLNRPSRT
eukprot:2238809-Amphidinium_carterae.2